MGMGKENKDVYIRKPSKLNVVNASGKAPAQAASELGRQARRAQKVAAQRPRVRRSVWVGVVLRFRGQVLKLTDPQVPEDQQHHCPVCGTTTMLPLLHTAQIPAEALALTPQKITTPLSP